MGSLFVFNSFAQTMDEYFEQQKIQQFKKLYLHTDREYYFVGDTLWFSPYIVLANDNQLIAENGNLYVELLDRNGQVVESKNFLLDHGICSGYLVFDNKLITAGTYVLRAYIDEQKYLGDNSFYKKTLNINNALPEAEVKVTEEKSSKVYIDFYPEGGFLLANQLNRTAFVAHDNEGQPIRFEGKLISSDGTQIHLSTSYKGMGSFIFIPKMDAKYSIEANADGKVQFRMPDMREFGAKLMRARNADNALILYIKSSPQFHAKHFYIAFFHKGIGKNYVKLTGKDYSKPISISIDKLEPGINRLVLLSDTFEPLSERLVFINKPSEDYQVQVTLSKNEFKTRDQVKMEFNIPEIKNSEAWARISVSVVDEKMIGFRGNSLDIRSYLLLDSELRGQVQNPGSYFFDEDSISSDTKIDLLLLTQGWRNYIYDQLPELDPTNLSTVPFGMDFKGTVKRVLTNRPFVNTDVYLNYANNDIRDMRQTKTDEQGCFRFDSVVFFDTALVMIQGKNYKDKNYTFIELSNSVFGHFPVNELNYKNLEPLDSLSLATFRLKYINELSLHKYFPDRSSRILEEINIVGKKKEDTHPRLYSKGASTSKKITEVERNYKDVVQYLRGRFAGVVVTDSGVTIRGEGSILGSNEALLLVDGMPVTFDMLYRIPMYDIDIVEIVKPPETAIFGSRGANGVVSVFTRSGVSYEPNFEVIPGTVIKKLQGFEKFRVFYSPTYSNSNIDVEMPDYRQTLYWNPSFVIDDKTRQLSFYTCDNLANYKILVEGISASGKICLGEASFIVNTRR